MASQDIARRTTLKPEALPRVEYSPAEAVRELDARTG
jgi:hypothetical protein